MSILIKGMEMPDCCTYCDYIGLNRAIGCGHFTNLVQRASDCPLVEVADIDTISGEEQEHEV